MKTAVLAACSRAEPPDPGWKSIFSISFLGEGRGPSLHFRHQVGRAEDGGPPPGSERRRGGENPARRSPGGRRMEPTLFFMLNHCFYWNFWVSYHFAVTSISRCCGRNHTLLIGQLSGKRRPGVKMKVRVLYLSQFSSLVFFVCHRGICYQCLKRSLLT